MRGSDSSRPLGCRSERCCRLYGGAIEKAGSTDPQKVLAALPTVIFTGARGPIQMDMEHHAPLTIYLAISVR